MEIVKDCDIELDLRGLFCPMPFLKIRQALYHMDFGQVLRFLMTDSTTIRDIDTYIEVSCHELLECKNNEGVYIYTLKKA